MPFEHPFESAPGRPGLLCAADPATPVREFLPAGLADQVGSLTVGGIDDAITLAGAFGRPVSVLLARVIAALLVPDESNPLSWFASDGLFHELALKGLDVAARSAPIESLPWVGALLDALYSLRDPESPVHLRTIRPRVIVRAGSLESGWVALDRSDEEITAELRSALGQPGAPQRWEIVLRSGFGDLTSADIEALDHGGGVLSCARTARALTAYGSPFVAYLSAFAGVQPVSEIGFEDRFTGTVDSAEDFIREVGQRDGWWPALLDVLLEHRLMTLVHVDWRRAWRLYEEAGWRLIEQDSGRAAFGPPGHSGPVPALSTILDADAERFLERISDTLIPEQDMWDDWLPPEDLDELDPDDDAGEPW